MSKEELSKQERFEKRKRETQEKLNKLQNNQDSIIESRKKELQNRMDRLSQNKGGDKAYADRDPATAPYPESKTVWQDLRDEFMELHNRPDEWVAQEEKKMKTILNNVEEELNG